MILYHASPFIIEHPDVSHSREHLDFGKGFSATKQKSMQCALYVEDRKHTSMNIC